MRELYIPSMDDLYEMQDMNVNIYKYILVKVIERIILEGVNYPNKGMLKNVYKYLRENLYIASSVGMLYPEEIKYSMVASMDIDLCMRVLTKEEDNRCNLDYLANFDSLTQTNTIVFDTVIIKLNETLKSNPRYRFEYKQSYLLDRIFKREITSTELMFSKDKIKELLDIEPAYCLSLKESVNVQEAFNRYANLYGIPSFVGEEYRNKDILTNPNTDVKRLLKCMKK